MKNNVNLSKETNKEVKKPKKEIDLEYICHLLSIVLAVLALIAFRCGSIF